MTARFIAGGWVDGPAPYWRPHVDLATAPRHLVYAAGMEDGYMNALADLRSLAGLRETADLFVAHWQAGRELR